MEKYLNEFLCSDLGLIDFCKQNNLNRVQFEKFLNEHSYYWKTKRSGKKVKDYKNAVDYYLSNKCSPTVAAKQFGLYGQSLKKELEERNLYDPSTAGLRKKSYNEHIFDIINTEEKAYWLGFIFADGYIYSAPLTKTEGRIDYNFELCSKGEDKDHMQKFAKFIEYNKDLKITKADKNGHTRCRVCLSSKHLWETLYSLGCTPNKSLTLKFPKKEIFTKESLIFDFIRGYLDGDGWISYSNKEHTQMCFGFLGTENFVNTIQDIFGTSLAIYHNHDNPEESTMKLLLHGKKGLNHLHKLYKNATIYLARKYEKYLEYCRLYEESYRGQSGNIGETPEMDNTEISSEIKESEPSYSVEVENYE